MTDRELLALAFKAYLPGENYTRMVNDAGSDYWNPLKDDGQALRLAVKLRIHIRLFPYDVEAQHERNYCQELDGPDPYAATRRAIVRAAAEIGKAMP